MPGVTTVLGKFKEPGGLMHWAWDLGMQGKDYREERGKAASIGTLAHTMAENYIRGVEVDYSDVADELLRPAEQAFGAFKSWTQTQNLQVVATEEQLTSEKYRYGGTMDAAILNGVTSVLSIGDWKTSGSIDWSYLCQIAAYVNLWNENHPEQPAEMSGHIVRFDRNNGDFHHHWYRNLDDAWRGFLLMRELYDLSAVLKKRV